MAIATRLRTKVNIFAKVFFIIIPPSFLSFSFQNLFGSLLLGVSPLPDYSVQ